MAIPGCQPDYIWKELQSRIGRLTCDPDLFFFLGGGGVLFLFLFFETVSLCSSGCPGTHFVDQASLELRNQPASASQVLGLKACATSTQLK
jgi:hypothetical protein